MDPSCCIFRIVIIAKQAFSCTNKHDCLPSSRLLFLARNLVEVIIPVDLIIGIDPNQAWFIVTSIRFAKSSRITCTALTDVINSLR